MFVRAAARVAEVVVVAARSVAEPVVSVAGVSVAVAVRVGVGAGEGVVVVHGAVC